MHQAYIKKLCATLYKGDGGISNIRYMYGESLVFSKQRNEKHHDFKYFSGHKICIFHVMSCTCMNHFTNVVMLDKDLPGKEPGLSLTEYTEVATHHILRHTFSAHAYQENHDHYIAHTLLKISFWIWPVA